MGEKNKLSLNKRSAWEPGILRGGGGDVKMGLAGGLERVSQVDLESLTCPSVLLAVSGGKH